MPYQTPEELEREADALLEAQQETPDTTVSDSVNEDQPSQQQEDLTEKSPDGVVKSGETETATQTADVGNEGQGDNQNAEERIKNAQARMHQATQEASEQKRQNDVLSGELNAIKQELEQLKQAEPPEGEPQNRDNLPQDLQSAMDDYPEVISPLMEQINQLNRRLDSVEGTSTQTAQAIEQRVKQETAEQHWNTIRQKHPDANEIAQSDDFQGWILRQPPMVQQAAERGSTTDAVAILDLYKQQMGTGARETPTPQIAASPSRAKAEPGNKATFTREQIASMDAKTFAANEEAIDRAMASGLIY